MLPCEYTIIGLISLEKQTRKEIVMVIYLSDDLCYRLLYATTGSNLVVAYFFGLEKCIIICSFVR